MTPQEQAVIEAARHIYALWVDDSTSGDQAAVAMESLCDAVDALDAKPAEPAVTVSHPSVARIAELDMAICRCPKCKGETDRSKLCAACKVLDAEIEAERKKAGRA